MEPFAAVWPYLSNPSVDAQTGRSSDLRGFLYLEQNELSGLYFPQVDEPLGLEHPGVGLPKQPSPEAPVVVWPSPSNLLTGGSAGTGLTWQVLETLEADLQRTVVVSVWLSSPDQQADGPVGTDELRAPLVGGWLGLLNP